MIDRALLLGALVALGCACKRHAPTADSTTTRGEPPVPTLAASPPALSLSDRCTRHAPGGRARSYSFVELVLESVAVVGAEVTAVSPAGGLPIEVAVRHSLPAPLGPKLRVAGRPSPFAEGPTFAVGESVVLFLCAAKEAEAELTGSGDVGKWPRAVPDAVFTEAHVRPATEVLRAADLVRRARDASKTGERAALIEELGRSGPLGAVAAAELAAKDDFWDDAAPEHGLGRGVVAALVVGARWSAPAPHDPMERYALLSALRLVPFAVGVPLLLERLDDADPAARDSAFASLQTLTLPLGAGDMGYDPHAADAERAAPVARWRAFWATHRPAALRRDVPALLAGLEADHVLGRRAAAAMLRLASGKDPGYDAAAPEPDRKRVAEAWHAWWRELAPSLRQRP
jgi:hypothetical protein